MEELDSKYASRIIRVSAHDRNLDLSNQTESSFEVVVDTRNIELTRVVGIQVTHVVMHNTFYNIAEGRNTLDFLDAALAPHTVTLPAGQYDVATFMTDLLALIDTELGDPVPTATYTFSPVTNKISMTFGESLTIDGGYTNYLAWKIGFGDKALSPVPSGVSITAPGIINLYGPHTAYISSRALSNSAIDFDAKNQTVNMIAYIPLDQPFNNTCHYEAGSSSTVIKYPQTRNFKDIDFRIRDIRGNLLDGGLHDWTIQMKVWYLL